jgi:hypothetical protein
MCGWGITQRLSQFQHRVTYAARNRNSLFKRCSRGLDQNSESDIAGFGRTYGSLMRLMLGCEHTRARSSATEHLEQIYGYGRIHPPPIRSAQRGSGPSCHAGHGCCSRPAARSRASRPSPARCRGRTTPRPTQARAGSSGSAVPCRPRSGSTASGCRADFPVPNCLQTPQERTNSRLVSVRPDQREGQHTHSSEFPAAEHRHRRACLGFRLP